MALFKAIVKSNRISNGVRLEKGMSVEFVSSYGNPLATNGGKDLIDAFMRAYGVDLKKACAVNSSYIEVKKI
ncbi:DUF6140 family protein [Polaribacter staleyi]|uniref:DUF6140 family protein n=1 Tax=Polaribacter staleyi TaxID=2022337 RepID=UPI0031BB3044